MTEPATKKVHIAVFDSGAGGLSITKEILSEVNIGRLTYLGDDLNLPYGCKPSKELEQLIVQQIQFLVSAFSPDIIILACNTASTQCLTLLRKQFPCTQFVGVVPAIKPASAISKTRTAILLATQSTCKSRYTGELISNFAKDMAIEKIPANTLVTLIEKLFSEGDPSQTEKKIDQYLLSLPLKSKADVMILACTHFPLIKSRISRALYGGVEIVDSGKAIAKRVKHLTLDKPTTKGRPEIQVILTSKNKDKERGFKSYLIEASRKIS